MSLVSRPLYRTLQFIAALRPQVDETESNAARSLLGPKLSPLFDSMTPRDRRHCLDVHAKLLDSGCAGSGTASPTSCCIPHHRRHCAAYHEMVVACLCWGAILRSEPDLPNLWALLRKSSN
jgi:hypothetical protein